MAPRDVATNRQASYRYNLLEKWEAGLVLQGTEVKALRDGKAQIKDGYASVRDGEVWLHNVHIPLYFRDGRAKVEIALARGKDVGDKRQSIKEREMKREMERAIRR